MRGRIPYGHQDIGAAEIRAVSRVLRSDWLTQGPAVAKFERALARRVKAREVVAVSSGTAALHAACFALGLKRGQEVITTPLTFVASANCALYVGATPRFADIDAATGTLDPRAVERAVTSKTKAIIPVDFAGNLCDWNALLGLARRRKVATIEDASHAIGGSYRGRPVGSFSDLTVFSFHPVKHITTGEGGAVATNSPVLAARLRRFRTHGITRDPKELTQHPGPWYYEMHDLGFNYRITDLQCALGTVQLSRLSRFVARRAAILRHYNAAFADLPHVVLPRGRAQTRPAWHLYVLRLAGPLVAQRRAIFETLSARGLGVNVHYLPVHLQPYYRRRFGYRPGDFPVAEAYSDSSITLPLYPSLTQRHIATVVNVVRRTIDAFARD